MLSDMSYVNSCEVFNDRIGLWNTLHTGIKYDVIFMKIEWEQDDVDKNIRHLQHTVAAISAESLAEGFVFDIPKEFLFEMKKTDITPRLIIGERQVARTAPNMPIFSGNIKM